MSGVVEEEEEEKDLLSDFNKKDVINAFDESIPIQQPQQKMFLRSDSDKSILQISKNEEKDPEEEEEEIATGLPPSSKMKSKYKPLPSTVLDEQYQSDLFIHDNQQSVMEAKEEERFEFKFEDRTSTVNVAIDAEESISKKDNNNKYNKQKSIDYAFNALNDDNINEQRDDIIHLVKSTEPDGVRKNIINYCNDNGQPYEAIYNFYETMKQYDDFQKLQSKLESLEKQDSCGKCCECYLHSELDTFKVIDRDILPNKIILKCLFYNYGFEQQQQVFLQRHFINTLMNDDEHKSNLSNMDKQNRKQYIEKKMDLYIQSNVVQHDKDEETEINPKDVRTIEISSNPYNIQYIDAKTNDLMKGDILCKINNMSLNGIETVDVYQFIKYCPLSTKDGPLTITFERKQIKCTQYIKEYIHW